MRLSLFIAGRYLFSKKSKNVIHLISIISMVVVAFVSAAMVIVMSAFNGIECLVDDLFSHFDAPIVIRHQSGASFYFSQDIQQDIMQDGTVKSCQSVLEDDVWISYNEANGVVMLKGVGPQYGEVSGIDHLMRTGQFDVTDTTSVSCVPGLGVCGQLKIPVEDEFRSPLTIKAPIKGKKLSRFRENAFSESQAIIEGVFSANAELDVKYLFVPLHNAQQILGRKDQVSSVEVYLKNDDQMQSFAAKWNPKLANDSLHVITRLEKNALIYKTTQSEKWATFAILLFILIIASFNIVSSLSMLILEKSNDLKIFESMGANKTFIERVFIFQGILINVVGGLLGITIGLLVCWGQEKFGWIPMQGAVVDHYPVKVDPASIGLIALSVLLTGTVFCIFMVKWLLRKRV